MRRINLFNSWFLYGLAGVCISGSMFFSSYGQALRGGDDNIWWTPRAMALSLEDTRDDFSVLIAGHTLKQHVDREALLLKIIYNDNQTKNDNKIEVIKAKDISFRINNWNKTKITLLQHAVLSAFFFGASVMSLIVGIVCAAKKNFLRPGG